MENFITGNAKVVRSINRAMILNIIRSKQPIPRTEIARITGLNKSTVSNIVADLLEEELVYEQVKSDQTIGRNPLNLFLRRGKYLVGAINIDITSTRFAVVDIDGTVLFNSTLKTEHKKPGEFIEHSLKELKGMCEKNKTGGLEGLGISIAGIVDSRNSTVNYAPNLGWENINVGSIVRKHLPGLKILSVGNDAKASALAELWFGTYDIDLSNFVFVSIGSGIGTGIVVENKILDGEFQASGEFGHITIFENGKACNCGNRGCWEEYASDRAVVRRYIESKNPKKGPKEYEGLLIEDIIELAHQKDPAAHEVIKETGYYLGLGITNIIRSVDPYAIIIGGKITQLWNLIYPEIIKVVHKRAFFGRERNILILPSSLKIRPRLLGAATLAIKEIFDYYRITNDR